MSINKEAMITWVNELYYGERKQAIGFLTLIADGERSHCCLGVACELFKKELESVEIIAIPEDDKELNEYDSYISYDYNSSFLPTQIVGLFGTEATIYMIHEGQEWNVIHGNDNLGLSFKEIAQGINLYYDLGLTLE